MYPRDFVISPFPFFHAGRQPRRSRLSGAVVVTEGIFLNTRYFDDPRPASELARERSYHSRVAPNEPYNYPPFSSVYAIHACAYATRANGLASVHLSVAIFRLNIDRRCSAGSDALCTPVREDGLVYSARRQLRGAIRKLVVQRAISR